MSSAGIVLILAAGQRVGKEVAYKFASNGYKVALVSRTVSDGLSPEGYLNVKADLSDREAVPRVFKAVEAALGPPNIVIYNGAKRELTPPDDPLSAPFETIEACRRIGLDSAYIAAQEALRVFRSLPSSTDTAFIFTGNALAQIAIPGVLPFALGKVAAAMLIEYCANAYGKDGYRFYFADERMPDGRPAAEGIDGVAHGEMYWELANEKKQSKWLVTFTKGQGRKEYIGVDFEGNTRASYDEMFGRN
ncbi:hypothetical protein H2200_003756 [Cladophialophora chaetospira]|uniref:Uncharacterized protein n=1 Tax=Cladophialophora chaetospira TaxID=386627 RepID=A0AA38XFL2_9EURO|nr:hypothetical protein H2200_003756 [Cladophialophora chaetospira]